MESNHRRSVSRVSLPGGVSLVLSLTLAMAPSLPVLAATNATTGGTSSQAQAQVQAEPEPEGDPEALSAAAVERFEAKEYDAAVELFEQAYAADPQPNYLFNIGRVYEEKGDLENAVVYYQRFVGQSGVDIESRQAATERLKVLREALAQMKADQTEVEPKDEVKPEPEPEPEPETAPNDDDAERAAKRKKTLRITGYSLLGVGGGALIVGAVMGSIASGTVEDANADPFVDRTQALRNRARRQAVVADAMFITGGVLAAAGLALVLSTLGRKKASAGGDTASRRTQWSPVVGPEQVGLGLTHRF